MDSIYSPNNLNNTNTEPLNESLTPSDNFVSATSYPPLEVVPEAPVIEEVVNLEPSEKVSYSDSSIQEIEISKIVANPYQPRKIFRPEALQELADSIKEHGVIQPVVVTETETGYELVVGERRFRASQLAGLTKVPAIVKKNFTGSN